MVINEVGQTTDFSNQQNQGTNSVDFVHIQGFKLDSPSDGLTRWSPEFDKWNKFYRRVPEYRLAVNKLVSWTFGRGFKGDKTQLKKIDQIKGFGKDSGRSVLKNIWRVAIICGDGFGHIIRDEQGRQTNLKPLNSEIVVIVASPNGILSHYELGKDKQRIELEDMYHLSYERQGDEIHGIPLAEALEKLLESRGEAVQDLRILYHRTVRPIQFFEVETNDQTKLNNVEKTINSAYKKSENVVISAGIIKEIKKSSQPQFSGNDINSLNYIQFLIRYFITSIGVPEVVMGWGAETTEASSKVIVTSFEQDIWDMKMYNVEMMKDQLNIKIDIIPAPSIMDDLKKDNAKDGKPAAVKDNDNTLELEGKK